jgi:CHAT domain-containing protein
MGLNEIERVYSTLEGPQQGNFLDEHDALADELISLLSENSKDEEAAYTRLALIRCKSLIGEKRDSSLCSSLDVSEIRDSLPRNTYLIEYAVLNDRLLIWVLGKNSFILQTKLISLREVQRLVLALRTSLERGDEVSFRKFAERLYDLLIGSLGRSLPKESCLLIAPDKSLYYVPFNLLMNSSGRFVIEDYIVSIVPSGSYCVLSARRHSGGEGPEQLSALVVGNPDFDRLTFNNLPALPFAREEADAVSKVYHSSLLLTGEVANKDTVVSNLGKYHVVHIAAHATFSDQNPMFSMILLAPVYGDSGTLLVRDLYQTDISGTRLVVLSGCSTSIGYVSNTAGVYSFAKPLLVAGVSVVIGSLWNVSDRYTSGLMVAFHSNYKVKRDGLAALRNAQLEILYSGGRELPRIVEWGAFQASGIVM